MFSPSSEARWISLAGLQNATLFLRRVLDLTKLPGATPITITALGYYELYVNGRRVGNRVIDQPLSNSAKRAFEVTHEVINYLRTGRNCIALWLGRGWYRGYGLGEPGNMSVHGPGPLLGLVHGHQNHSEQGIRRPR